MHRLAWSVFNVLKQIHPRAGILLSAMAVITDINSDLLARLASNIRSQLSGPQPPPADDDHAECSMCNVQWAVRLVLPGELSTNAFVMGTKAVTKFGFNHKDWNVPHAFPKVALQKWLESQNGVEEDEEEDKEADVSKHSGLQFPVLHIECALTRELGGHIVAPRAAVYMAAVLEYITAEILEPAGKAARDLGM